MRIGKTERDILELLSDHYSLNQDTIKRRLRRKSNVYKELNSLVKKRLVTKETYKNVSTRYMITRVGLDELIKPALDKVPVLKVIRNMTDYEMEAYPDTYDFASGEKPMYAYLDVKENDKKITKVDMIIDNKWLAMQFYDDEGNVWVSQEKTYAETQVGAKKYLINNKEKFTLPIDVNKFKINWITKFEEK